MKRLLCVCLCLLFLTAPILAVEEVPEQDPAPEEPPIKCEDTNNDGTSVLPPDDTSNDILLAAMLMQTAMSGLRMGSFFRRVRYKLTRLLKRTYFRLMNWILRMTLRLWR